MTAAHAGPARKPDIRLNEPHDHHAIGAMLRRRNTNLRRVALEAGLYESACRLALISRGYPKAEAAIAAAVGYPVEELWPDRYPALARSSSKRNASAMSRRKRVAAVDAGGAEA